MKESLILFFVGMLLIPTNLSLSMHKAASLEKDPLPDAAKSGFNFLNQPYTKRIIFPKTNGQYQNSGTIATLPEKAKFIFGSVFVRSRETGVAFAEHVNYLLGDITYTPGWKTNNFFKWTWHDDDGVEVASDFGKRLIALTQPGEKDQYRSFYGIWRFAIIPLRNDNTFDIIPSGFSGFDDEIAFNLIGYIL